ncbi:MAG: hypothetical protein ABI376_07225 [Caulobacteraceae bacterium]
MTPPRTIMSAVLDSAPLRRARTRRAIFAVLAVILAVLCVWPRTYLAKAALLPDDSGGGLSSFLGGAVSAGGGLLGTLFGGRQSIEVDLAIARSHAVVAEVAAVLVHERVLKTHDLTKATMMLRKVVRVEAVRGGLLMISTEGGDSVRAKTVVSTYVDVLRSHLSQMTLRQAAEKKAVASNRFEEATATLARTQAELDRFRQQHKLAMPEAQLGPAISLLTGLQANLQAQETALRTQLQFATNENIQVQAARARIASLNAQIAAAQAGAGGGAVGGPTLGGLTPELSEYENLYRAVRAAEAEYEIYKRYLSTVAVEEVSSGINMEVIEPPYISPERQIHTRAAGALVLLIILAGLAEVYLYKRRTDLA